MPAIHDKTARRIARHTLPVLRAIDAWAKPIARVVNARCPTEPGCAACCSKTVETHLADALVLVDHVYRMRPTRLKVYEVKAREHSRIFRACATSAEWFELQNGCVFLNEANVCEVYPARPTTCRCHFVVTEPEQCQPGATGKYGSIDAGRLEGASTRSAREILEREGINVITGPLPDIFLLALNFYRGGLPQLEAGWSDARAAFDHAVELYLEEVPPERLKPFNPTVPEDAKFNDEERAELDAAFDALAKVVKPATWNEPEEKKS